MFRKKVLSIFVASAVSFAVGHAFAAHLQSSMSCVEGYGVLFCTATWGTATDPYVRKVPSSTATHADSVRWIARCRPKLFQDRYGVSRYRYAARSCEFGVVDPGDRGSETTGP
jgi:hypothetical protein